MAHYPAGQSPAPDTVGNLSRRAMLRGSALAAGAITLPSILAACGSGGSSGGSSSGGGTGGKTVTFGSNHTDPQDKAGMEAALKAYEAKSGKTVKINAVSHNDYQTNISRYLQGNPDDVFSWFAGNRMQFFANKGLATDISDIWKEPPFDGFTQALKDASTSNGKQYFVPFYYYPWAVFYRKSVFEQKGYQVPKTWDEYKALGAKMKNDGLPIAMGNKDGWPPMGTFDYINMRLNGYDFHISLMGGKEDWTGAKVKGVFDTWKSIMPYYQPDVNGRTWQEAGNALANKQAGMYVLGMFVGAQFKPEELSDLDYFPFPEIDPANAQDSIEAPIDGFMLSKKPKDEAAAKDLLKFLGSPAGEEAYLKAYPSNVACHKDADTSSYNALQKKAVEMVSSAKHVSQFMDRDTRPDFAQNVMIPAIQQFLGKPDDIDSILKNVEAQKKSIFASE